MCEKCETNNLLTPRAIIINSSAELLVTQYQGEQILTTTSHKTIFVPILYRLEKTRSGLVQGNF